MLVLAIVRPDLHRVSPLHEALGFTGCMATLVDCLSLLLSISLYLFISSSLPPFSLSVSTRLFLSTLSAECGTQLNGSCKGCFAVIQGVWEFSEADRAPLSFPLSALVLIYDGSVDEQDGLGGNGVQANLWKVRALDI